MLDGEPREGDEDGQAQDGAHEDELPLQALPAEPVRYGADDQEPGQGRDAEEARVECLADVSDPDLGEEGRTPGADEPLRPDRRHAGQAEQPERPAPEDQCRPGLGRRPRHARRRPFGPAGRLARRPAATLAPGAGWLGHEPADQDGRHEGEEDQDHEDPAPGHHLPEQATHHETERGAEPEAREGDPLPHRQALGGRGGRDDGPIVGEVHPLGQPGQEPGQPEDEERGREAGQERARGDGQDPRDEDALQG